MPIILSKPASVLVRARHSCRTFSPHVPEPEALKQISLDAASVRRGLLGEHAKFSLVEIQKSRNVRFTDYGLVSGSRFFLLGSISRSERFRESYAYLLERLVLKAVDLGLDSCWVGYFKAEYFKDYVLGQDEERPAVVVVGRGAGRPRLRDRLVRASIRAASRKPWGDLFFDGGFRRPLSESRAGTFAPALEMVRRAPSSGNTQPWRVLKEDGSPTFHFFMKKIRKAYAARGLHEVDIGIAMSHFDLGCREENLRGNWILSPPDIPLPFPDIEYRWTWSGRAHGSE